LISVVSPLTGGERGVVEVGQPMPISWAWPLVLPRLTAFATLGPLQTANTNKSHCILRDEAFGTRDCDHYWLNSLKANQLQQIPRVCSALLISIQPPNGAVRIHFVFNRLPVIYTD
jgi:hypothetical protein